MGERKVLNKYFPPDFDPSIIPKVKRPKNKQVEVRMMLPFSIQCNTCGEYMYRGKKFNSRKEDVLEENYHGIRIYRFYIKCVTCSSEITFKTDPANGDYVSEHGCSRNFEPWRETKAITDAKLKQKEEEELGDSMKVLENRTLDSKREMDILDALDEIKAINQRHERVNINSIIETRNQNINKNNDKNQTIDINLAKNQFLKAKQEQFIRMNQIHENKKNNILKDDKILQNEQYKNKKENNVNISINVSKKKKKRMTEKSIDKEKKKEIDKKNNNNQTQQPLKSLVHQYSDSSNSE